ncbi:MAG: PKD domain-containing protein, partial [Thermoplasmata archaeon]
MATGEDPEGVAYDAQNGFIYVTSDQKPYITVINGTLIVAQISPSGVNGAGTVVYDPDDGLVYAGFYNQIVILNGSSVLTTLPSESIVSGGAFDSGNGDVYFSGELNGNVTILHGTTVVDELALGGRLGGVAYDSQNGLVYVAQLNLPGSSYPGGVIVLNGTSIAARIADPQEASFAIEEGLVFDPRNGLVYAEDGEPQDTLVEINGTSVVGTIPINRATFNEVVTAGVFDPVTGDLFYLDEDGVVVVNGSSEIAAIPSGGYIGLDGIGQLTFDGSNGDVYVANDGEESSQVSILNGTLAIPFISAFTSTLPTVELQSANSSTTTLHVDLSSGSGLSYFYDFFPSLPGCTSVNASSLTCTPVQNEPYSIAGSYVITAYANSTIGSMSLAGLTLNLVLPLTVAPTVSLSPTDANYTITFNANPAQGLEPIAFDWSFGDGNHSSLQNPTYAFGHTGNYSVRLSATDALGGRAQGTIDTNVDAGLSMAMSVSNSTPELGQSIAVHITAVGGVPPYTFTYTALPPGCFSSGNTSIACIPTQAGTYN